MKDAVLSFKVDKELLRELEEIARDDNSDRSATARRLLDIGLRKWKVNKAFEMVRGGKVSIWRGSSLAGTSLREFMDILSERKTDSIDTTPEELDASPLLYPRQGSSECTDHLPEEMA